MTDIPAATTAAPHNAMTQALITAQMAFDTVRKENENPHFRSRYADLSTVLEAVLPSLHAHGILLTQPIIREGDELILQTSLRHISGEEIVSEVPLPMPVQWQQWGSALTYARRYSILALLGVAPEDDDGNEAQAGPRQARSDGWTKKPHGQVDDPARKAALAAKAKQAAPPPAKPPAATASAPSEPVAEPAAGPQREWTREALRGRGTAIAAALRDHGGEEATLDDTWKFHLPEIKTMPASAQEKLRDVVTEARADIQACSGHDHHDEFARIEAQGRDEDERAGELPV